MRSSVWDQDVTNLDGSTREPRSPQKSEPSKKSHDGINSRRESGSGQAEATDVYNRCIGEKARDYHYHLCHMGSMTQGEQAKKI